MISNSQTLTDQSKVGVESNTYDENESYPVADIQPVPMSAAVLQQCNFTHQQYLRFWQLIGTYAEPVETATDSEDDFVEFLHRPMVKNIASLHQLQNMYYMLFNKELDFDVEITVVVDGTVRGVAKRN